MRLSSAAALTHLQTLGKTVFPLHFATIMWFLFLYLGKLGEVSHLWD